MRQSVAERSSVYGFRHFRKSEVTVFQLAKFIALTLRWPLLITDLDRDDTLLRQLERIAMKRDGKAEGMSALGEVWSSRDRIQEFIRIGLSGIVTENENGSREWSFETLDVHKLLQISPQMRTLSESRWSERGWSSWLRRSREMTHLICRAPHISRVTFAERRG